jgi:hypothetical protein
MKLKVYPNPFVALGPDGMPCGRVLVEPGHPRPYDVVGGKIQRQKLDRDEGEAQKKARNLDTRDPLVRGVAVVRMAPVEVPSAQYHKERIARGDLIAADLPTWRALGFAKKEFRDALDILAEYAATAIEEWNASHEDPPALAAFALVETNGEVDMVEATALPTDKAVDKAVAKAVVLAALVERRAAAREAAAKKIAAARAEREALAKKPAAAPTGA